MVSLAITSYNRTEFTIRSFAQVIEDSRISEIIVVDDCSTDNSYNDLRELFKYNLKVKLYRNETNLGCALNKRRAVELASNHWVIIFDSDNIIGEDYIDTIFDYAWDEDVILAPEFLMPNFDFRAYSGLLINRRNVAQYIDEPMFETALNAHNLFSNRNGYLEVISGEPDCITSDSIYFAYKWLESGRSIYITPKLQYWHEVHPLSHYQTHIAKTPNGLHETILNNLKSMR